MQVNKENIISFENFDRENIEEWFDRHSNDRGFQYLNDADIVSIATKTEEKSGDYISHKTAMTYVEALLDFTQPNGI